MTENKKSIAIFDSGIGGLGVMRELIRILPEENMIYFADTARVPYGGKSPKTIMRFAKECIQYLVTQNIKCIVFACHTISSVMYEHVKAEFSIPFFGILEPSCELLCHTTKNNHVAILATQATVETFEYPRLIKEKLPNATVAMITAPLLVPLVEEGWVTHPIAYEIVREYLLPLKETSIDTLLLGCTHYQFLKETIRLALPKEVKIIDGSKVLAEKVATTLGEEQLLDHTPQPIYRFIVTDHADKFPKYGEEFLGYPISSTQVEEVEI